MSTVRPRPSLAGRRSSAFTTTTTTTTTSIDHPVADIAADPRLTEEIAEIKRYEDFTTIDWVQDAAREQIRRRARRRDYTSRASRGGRWDVRNKARELYDVGQGWIVVTLVGAAIGINAAVLNIATEWLSDFKRGYCTTAFYLNESFCCWGSEDGCDEWHRWSSHSVINFIFYFVFAIFFAFTASTLVKSFAPYAAGSGISELKCIIAGFVMKGFLSFWTLLIKSVALPLTIASGLSVGKEGPSVHYAMCTGHVISRFFDKYKRSASKTREILSATAATGVAVAFGSPIGGVLFSLEEMSSHFPLKTMWRSYFCALVGTAFLAAMNPFRTGKLVMFQVSYDRYWHFFELPFFIVLGVFGALYGALVTKGHMRASAFRKKYLATYPVQEAVVLTGITAFLCYPNKFLRIDLTEMMEVLFLECEGGQDYGGLCEAENRRLNIASLAYATVLRMILHMISYGCKVPAGCFVPAMAIGASFGRMVGMMVEVIHHSYPSASYFAACEPDVPCITPGTYAFLGAGAALSGVMNIYVSVVVIMFEITGALTYILPTMIVVGVVKVISSYFPGGGIADKMIVFNGYPIITKEDHDFNVPVSTCMTPASGLSMLPAAGITLRELEQILTGATWQGFPIVTSTTAGQRILLGYLGRTELLFAINKAREHGPVSPEALCVFFPADPTIAPRSDVEQSRERPLPVRTPSSAAAPPVTFDSMAQQQIDFARFIDATPLTVHPRLSLDTVMEIFKKMGPRVILVEVKGKLAGLVTVKDCLKYQFREEAAERQAQMAGSNGRDMDARLWAVIVTIAGWVGRRIGKISRGHIRVGSGSSNTLPLSGWGRGDDDSGHERYNVDDDPRILDDMEDAEMEARR